MPKNDPERILSGWADAFLRLFKSFTRNLVPCQRSEKTWTETGPDLTLTDRNPGDNFL